MWHHPSADNCWSGCYTLSCALSFLMTKVYDETMWARWVINPPDACRCILLCIHIHTEFNASGNWCGLNCLCLSLLIASSVGNIYVAFCHWHVSLKGKVLTSHFYSPDSHLRSWTFAACWCSLFLYRTPARDSRAFSKIHFSSSHPPRIHQNSQIWLHEIGSDSVVWQNVQRRTNSSALLPAVLMAGNIIILQVRSQVSNFYH